MKRVVGLPGEEIELRDGVLHVDGSPQVSEPFPRSGGADIGCGLMIGQKYALLGDNQALVSEPSAHAVVAQGDLVGRVVRILRWSLSSKWQSL